MFQVVEYADNDAWVQYFRRIERNCWSLEDTLFNVDNQEIVEKVQPPEVILRGARMYYKFKE